MSASNILNRRNGNHSRFWHTGTLCVGVLLLIFLLYMIIRFIVLIITPLDTLQSIAAVPQEALPHNGVEDYISLEQNSLFGNIPAGDEGIPDVSNVAETSLDIGLLGAFANGEGGGTAIFDFPPQGEQVFSAGEKIGAGVILKEVWWDRALIVRRGVLEQVFMKRSTDGSGADAGGLDSQDWREDTSVPDIEVINEGAGEDFEIPDDESFDLYIEGNGTDDIDGSFADDPVSDPDANALN